MDGMAIVTDKNRQVGCREDHPDKHRPDLAGIGMVVNIREDFTYRYFHVGGDICANPCLHHRLPHLPSGLPQRIRAAVGFEGQHAQHLTRPFAPTAHAGATYSFTFFPACGGGTNRAGLSGF